MKKIEIINELQQTQTTNSQLFPNLTIMPQYIACPNDARCARTGYVASKTANREDCEFCGAKVRKLLNVNGFLPTGWTTHEMAENICRSKALALAQNKVKIELNSMSAMSESQRKKYIRTNTIKYEREFLEKIKAYYKLV